MKNHYRQNPNSTRMNTSTPILTRTECAALRGLAIIGIFLHNYCHWLGAAVKENEYTFTLAKSQGMLHAVLLPDSSLPIHLLSFFGHYGVPVFLFLSAYGLTLKYEQPVTIGRQPSVADAPGVWPFIRKHFAKLFSMMIAGYVIFTLVDAMLPGRHVYHTVDVIGQLLMLNNLLPDPDRVIWPGPYWFFGLMLQLYAVYRLALYRRSWKTVVALIVLCWAAQAFCAPEGDVLNRVRYNFMGGMLPFGAGILFARYGRPLSQQQWALTAFVSAVAVFACSFHFQTWLWAPLFVCTGAVGLVKALPRTLNGWLAWVGGISAALFVIHPVTRRVFFTYYHGWDNAYTGLALYVTTSIALAWFYHEMRARWHRTSAKQKQ